MTIEIALLISVISLGATVYNTIMNARTRTKADEKQITTIIVKLETIQTAITEIKTTMYRHQEDITNLQNRVTIVEQSVKSAHKRLDELCRN